MVKTDMTKEKTMTETLREWEIGSGVRPRATTTRRPSVVVDHCEPRVTIKSGREIKDRSLADRLRQLGPYPRKTSEHLARQQLHWLTERAQILDSHRRREAVREAAIRMRSSEAIDVDLSEGQKRVRRNATRIRQSEAWRHKQLNSEHQEAETEMQLAWQCRTSGIGPSASRYDGMPGQRDAMAGPESAALEQVWIDWANMMNAKRVSLAVVIEVLSEPRTLADIERSRRLERGRAMEIYRAGLDLWLEVRRRGRVER
jgi:hypothetical protein